MPMAAIRKAIVLAVLLAGSGCGGGGADPPGGDATFTFDLSRYHPGQTPPALRVANSTLAFPLGRGPATQVLSETAPGELVVAYTRVGCWVEPEEWIGAMGPAAVRVDAGGPVHLAEVVVDQVLDPLITATPQALAEGTCVTYRTPQGKWRAVIRPTRVTTTAGSVRTSFGVDAAGVDAAAIFLPSYTHVSRVSYRVGPR